MARNQTNKPGLTPGNVVFLYGVLRDALGTGKQTFITHVETALADKRLTAADLGFDSTQELLESLGDGIKLTIFKGGRLYATVVEHPEWDAALAGASKKEERKPGAKGNKPWKRKKGDKAIKPSCPKRVKREPEPKAEAHTAVAPASSASVADTCGDAVEVAAAAQATVESPGADAHAGTATSSRAAETAATHDGQPHRLRNANFSLEDEEQSGKPDDTESSDAVDSTGTPESDAASGTEPSIEAQPEPSIAVTIVYDPYTGIDEETVIKPTPGAYVPAQPDIFIGQAVMCPPPAPEPAQDRPSTPEAARAVTKGASPAPETMHAPGFAYAGRHRFGRDGGTRSRSKLNRPIDRRAAAARRSPSSQIGIASRRALQYHARRRTGSSRRQPRAGNIDRANRCDGGTCRRSTAATRRFSRRFRNRRLLPRTAAPSAHAAVSLRRRRPGHRGRVLPPLLRARRYRREPPARLV